MNTKHMTAHSINEAWQIANEIFPTDYEQDSRASQNAGYPIYWSTLPGCAAWISDLCTRLEINLQNGETVVIWIEEEGEIAEAEIEAAVAEAVEEEIEEERKQEAARAIEATKTAERMTVEALFTPEVCQKVTLSVNGYSWASDDEKTIYEAIKAEHPTILFDLLTRYSETHGIKWGSIWGTKAQHISNRSGEGHYIITGYISARIGSEIDFLTNCAEILRDEYHEHEEKK